MIIIMFIWKHHHFIFPKSNFITNSLRTPLHLHKEGIVSRMHRVTCGMSPGKKWRLIPWLIPHTKYIVCSSYKRTHNLFNQICYFLLLETKGFGNIGYATMSFNYTQRLTKFPFSNLFSRYFKISLYLLAFHFVLRSMLVSNPTVNSRAKIEWLILSYNHVRTIFLLMGLKTLQCCSVFLCFLLF